MNFKEIMLMVTEDCNYNCKYCYQTKENKYMNWLTAKRAILFFLNLPTLPQSYQFLFYGGEPLLNFELIKKSVFFIEEKNELLNKKANFAITTNGSLLTKKILKFLNEHKFKVELSFDGFAQNKGREKGTFKQSISLIKEILTYPQISLFVNSVFTSETINHLSESIKLILDLNVPQINASTSLTKRWNQPSIKKMEDEFKKMRRIALDHFKLRGTIPLTNLNEEKEKGIWQCSAGQNTITINPDGDIWGCVLFYEYLKGKENTEEYKRYFFGYLEEFIKNYKERYSEIVYNYSQFSMDEFYTSKKRCFLCSELKKCSLCPVITTFTGYPIGKIPDYICKITQIQSKEKDKFLKEIRAIKKNNERKN